jgi:heterodisulfide reductase subunit C
MIQIGAEQPFDGLQQTVEAISGQVLSTCLQCGTCTAGCPFGAAMDLPPHLIIRHVLLGQTDVLARESLWLCTACATCSDRCPRTIDVAAVLAALRRVALKQKAAQPVNPAQVPRNVLVEVPPLALVAAFRTQTGDG